MLISKNQKKADTESIDLERVDSAGMLPPVLSRMLSGLSLPACIAKTNNELVSYNEHFHELFPQVISSYQFDEFLSSLSYGFKSNSPKLDVFSLEYPVSVYNNQENKCYRLNGSLISDDLLLLILEDISIQESIFNERQKHHEQLIYTSKSLSVTEMATVLAHELNQPIGSITNYLNLAKKFALNPNTIEKTISLIELAKEQTQQCADFISHIRDFVETREPVFTEQNPTEALRKPLTLVKPQTDLQKITINLNVEQNLPKVSIDQILIEQVFANLIRNAVEAMRDTPEELRSLSITIKREEDGKIEYCVSDTGKGVDNKQESQLFNPFFSTKPGGMGVGLAICRSIVELHGGRLYISNNRATTKTNESPKGTTFVCVLPSIEQFTQQ